MKILYMKGSNPQKTFSDLKKLSRFSAFLENISTTKSDNNGQSYVSNATVEHRRWLIHTAGSAWEAGDVVCSGRKAPFAKDDAGEMFAPLVP